MGMLGAAMSVGMVLGPGIGGLLAGSSLSTPFFVAAGLSVVALLLVVVTLPESLPVERRPHGKGVRGPQLRAMWQALRSPLGFLLFLAFLLSFGLANFEGVFGLWTLRRFEYGPQQVGSIMMIIGIISAIAQGVLTGMTTRRWGEFAVIHAALLCTGIGFLLMLTATSFATVLLTVGFFVLSNAMIGPSVASLISKQATERPGDGHGAEQRVHEPGPHRRADPGGRGAGRQPEPALHHRRADLLRELCLCMRRLRPRPLRSSRRR